MAPFFLLSSASLYFDSLDQSLRLAREAGFAGLEFSLTPATFRADPGRVAARVREAGLVLASVHPPTIPLPGWGRSPAAARRLGELARSLPGCQIVVLHAPAAPTEKAPRMERFYRRFYALQEALAGSPIRVALENRNRRPGEPLAVLDRPDSLLEFSRRHDCGLVLDTAHASTLPFPLLETFRTMRERLCNIHLSDVVAGGWWQRFSYPRSILGHHRPPGQGMLPLRAMLEELGQSDYRGLITLEMSPVALHFWSRPATRQILSRSLQDCRHWLDIGK